MNKYTTDYIEDAFKRIFNVMVFAKNGIKDYDDTDQDDSISIWMPNPNDTLSKEEFTEKWDYDLSVFPFIDKDNNKKKYKFTYLVHDIGSYDVPPSDDEVESKEDYHSIDEAIKGILTQYLEMQLEDMGMYYFEKEEADFWEEHKDFDVHKL